MPQREEKVEEKVEEKTENKTENVTEEQVKEKTQDQQTVSDAENTVDPESKEEKITKDQENPEEQADEAKKNMELNKDNIELYNQYKEAYDQFTKAYEDSKTSYEFLRDMKDYDVEDWAYAFFIKNTDKGLKLYAPYLWIQQYDNEGFSGFNYSVLDNSNEKVNKIYEVDITNRPYTDAEIEKKWNMLT